MRLFIGPSPLFIALALWLCSAFVTLAWGEEFASGDHVKVTWLAPDSFSNSTPKTTIALHFEVDEHWHVYWRNPGDSGAAPRFNFSGEGVTVSQPIWPAPTRLPIEHLTNIGYEGNVAYLFELDLSEAAQQNQTHLNLTVDLEWLVCKVDCIPGFATMTLTRPINAEPPQWQQQALATLNAFKKQIPKPADQLPLTISPLQWQADSSSLLLDVLNVANDAQLNAWPIDGDYVAAAKPKTTIIENGLRFEFKTLPVTEPPKKLEFVLAVNDKAWQSGPLTVVTKPLLIKPAPEALPLILLVGLALIGGVILNLMPCVFPVLSIKCFQLIQSEQSQKRMQEGLLYGVGVLATFIGLGVIFLSLRSAGLAVGWGFQLQSPTVVLLLVILFWCLALGFLGVYEWGNRITQWAGNQQGASAFLTGVLAVFVAAPCTGPFMGAALGAAAIASPLQALVLFTSMGVGLALPMVALSVWPKLLHLLPAPGPWMVKVREFFAFPLFATVLWLIWVLAQLVGQQAWLYSGVLLLFIALAFWLVRLNLFAKIIAVVVVCVAFIVASPNITTVTNSSDTASDTSGAWQSFNAIKLAEYRQQNKAVFMDFTAAWCITCQVNKSLVLDTEAAQQLFNQNNVELMRADWTKYDPDITAALAEHGRNSVPLYLYYPPEQGQVKVLPQILSIKMLKDAVTTNL